MMAATIDGIIILLLIGSISYGYLVSRKVRLLVTTLEELEPLVEAFSSAVDKSEYSVAQMRENIQDASRAKETAPQPENAQETAEFSSRRIGSHTSEVTGMRVVRDKKELVRAFFENSNPARI